MKVKRTTFKYRNLIGNDMALKFKNNGYTRTMWWYSVS